MEVNACQSDMIDLCSYFVRKYENIFLCIIFPRMECHLLHCPGAVEINFKNEFLFLDN